MKQIDHIIWFEMHNVNFKVGSMYCLWCSFLRWDYVGLYERGRFGAFYIYYAIKGDYAIGKVVLKQTQDANSWP